MDLSFLMTRFARFPSWRHLRFRILASRRFWCCLQRWQAHQNVAIQSQKSTFIYHNFLSQGFFLTRAGLSALLNDCKSVIFWSPSENKLPPQAQRVQQTKVYFQQNFIFVTKLVTKHETVNSSLTWQLQLQREFSSILDYSIVCLFVLSFNSRRNSTE